MSKTADLSDWDRIAAELRYLIHVHDWDRTPACRRALVEWHLQAIATARAETWIPGLAGSPYPAVEKALRRLHQHHCSGIIRRLRDDNTRLTLQLLTARACVEF